MNKKKPIMALAPMANVTDAAFRRIIAKYGKPDLMWTEFVSADGLMSAGREALLRDLEYSESERPIIAQLFTGHPDKMFEAAKLVERLGFDGLDINMGCPDRAVEKQGGGAAMLKDFKNTLGVLEAARVGAPNIPVSIKTRLGYNKIQIEDWISFLLKQNLPILTIHLRTRKEMSDVAAHWDLLPEIIKMRDEISPKTLILGNGDVASLPEAKKKAEASGADGVMIGRGIFGNPWFFSGRNSVDISIKEKLLVLIEHAKLFENLLGDIKSFAIMKKHFKAYVSGWDGAKELRLKLMETDNASQVDEILKHYIDEDCG